MTFHFQEYIGWKLLAINVLAEDGFTIQLFEVWINLPYKFGVWAWCVNWWEWCSWSSHSMQSPFLCGFDMISILLPKCSEKRIALPLLYHLNQVDGATPRTYRQPKRRCDVDPAITRHGFRNCLALRWCQQPERQMYLQDLALGDNYIMLVEPIEKKWKKQPLERDHDFKKLPQINKSYTTSRRTTNLIRQH